MSDKWFPVRKKPVEVEARGPVDESEQIETTEGTMQAEPGDYIIRGVEGEKYPVKPDIFEKTYHRTGSGSDAVLDEMEQWTIVEHLMNGYRNFEESELPEEQRQEGMENLAQLLDKLSPNWRDADSCREIETHQVIISERSEQDG